MKQNNASKYFDREPNQWGLRGDPLLWKELKTAFQEVNVPTSALELEHLLHKHFKELTGKSPKRGTHFFLKKYDKGGMSSGMVSSDFWLETGFATIIQRYVELEMR
ncbi:hypothetical protein [Parapedobacter sp. DT-150]|uniref:hypothetical protein n=1 Tax=Parapedobacter sp. DT-150 TaxID=3396162 RepID=UPI003F1BDA10